MSSEIVITDIIVSNFTYERNTLAVEFWLICAKPAIRIFGSYEFFNLIYFYDLIV